MPEDGAYALIAAMKVYEEQHVPSFSVSFGNIPFKCWARIPNVIWIANKKEYVKDAMLCYVYSKRRIGENNNKTLPMKLFIKYYSVNSSNYA